MYGDYQNDVVEGSTSHSTKNYTILDEATIRLRQTEEISHISSMFCLSPSESTLLLCHYKWNAEKLFEDWFTDELVVRSKVGLSNTTSIIKTETNKNGIICGICFDEFENIAIQSLSCGHSYCNTCWKQYISTALTNTGSGILSLRCPEFECGVAVTKIIVDSLCSEEEIKKYDHFLIRSYVESKKAKIKWCPAPGCECAVEFERGGDDGFGYDVTCACLYSFCWNCLEEPHRPVNCELYERWMAKNASEAENMKWILAFTKPCPQCKRPIEKSIGCNHMICRPPCNYHFCWLCLGDWFTHSGCNSYIIKHSNAEIMRHHAQNSLQRYAHYYERWASNNKSQRKAKEDLHQAQTVGLTKLSDKVAIPESQLTFIPEAWKQIIECRHILKWTYAYGFFLEEREPGKRQFFEYLQGQAETYLERLHACAEIELSPFLNDNAAKNLANDLDFSRYHSKLISLTKVTGKHFEELVRALENGLSDVVVPQDVTPTPSPMNQVDSDNQRRISVTYIPNFIVRPPIIINGAFWNCVRCAYPNLANSAYCQMCFRR
ncbi:putative E3 ubiquitin-protein ligase ARI7, partial [Bienertia sinuspersici]